MKKRAWLAAASAVLCAAICAALAVALPAAASPRLAGVEPRARHVVVVGISGLTWNTASQTATPELWRLAENGSVGAMVDYAEQPLACPADGWLTLNSAARAQAPRAQGPRPCAALPAVTTAPLTTAPLTTAPLTTGGASAQVASMPQLIKYNQQFDEAPDWGLLASSAACATAVGPGAALALATPSGHVASYVPSAADLSPSVLARCPLTVVDLGQIHSHIHSPSSNERPAVAAKRSAASPSPAPTAAKPEAPTSAGRPAGPHSTAELIEFQQGRTADAPLCLTCGTKMRPAGSCYVCEGCGSTSGCS